MDKVKLVIIGGGIAGMSSSIGAKENNIDDVLLLECEEKLGGVANQCIHNNFGKKILGECVTAPEYIEYLKTKMEKLNVKYKVNTMVLSISEENIITYVNPYEGVKYVKAEKIIIATGSREKFTGRIKIVNNKTTGIYTVGTAQQFVNLYGYLPGKEIVIVGINERSIIIARRLIIEGATIKAMIDERQEDDVMLNDNINILKEFNIPIICAATIEDFDGKERVESVRINYFKDEKLYKRDIECDCLLISAAWVPETEVIKDLGIEVKENGAIIVDNNMRTNKKDIYACGNVVNCYKKSDDTTIEGIKAGESVFFNHI